MGHLKLLNTNYNTGTDIWRGQLLFGSSRISTYDNTTVAVMVSRLNPIASKMLEVLHGHIAAETIDIEFIDSKRIPNADTRMLANTIVTIATGNIALARSIIAAVQVYNGSDETKWYLRLYIRMIVSLIEGFNGDFDKPTVEYILGCPGLNDVFGHVVDPRLVECFTGHKYTFAFVTAIEEINDYDDDFLDHIVDTTMYAEYEDSIAFGIRIAEHYVDKYEQFKYTYDRLMKRFDNSSCSSVGLLIVDFISRINKYIEMVHQQRHPDASTGKLVFENIQYYIEAVHRNMVHITETANHDDIQTALLILIYLVVFGIYTKL